MPFRDSNTHFRLPSPSTSTSSPFAQAQDAGGRSGSPSTEAESYGSPTSTTFGFPRTSTLPVQNPNKTTFSIPRTITAPVQPSASAQSPKSNSHGAARRKSRGYGSMAVSPPTIDEQYSSLASPTREFREGPLPAFRARRVSMARSPPGPLVQDEEMGTGGGQSSRSMPRKKSQDVDQNYTRISASIRDSSNRLASLSFKPRASISSLTSGSNEAASISPYSLRFTHHHHSVSSGHSVPVHPLPGPSHLYETLLSPQSSGSGGVAQADGSPRLSRTSPKVPLEPINSEDVSPTQSQSGPSGLSRMMELEKARSAKIHSPIHEGVELPDDTTPRPSRGQSTVQLSAGAASPDQSNSPDDQLAMPTITDSGRKSNRTEMAPAIIVEPSEEEEQHAARTLQRYITKTLGEEDEENNDNSGSSENSPLLRRRSESLAHDKTHEHGSGSGRLGRTRWELNQRVRKMTWKGVLSACVADPLKTLPSVILGMLLNVLDGVSYGMILFPATPVFNNFGLLGVSMFFMSCIVSQLVFSLGGSIFPGGNGSMMIEAVPFFHILVNIIQQEVGDDDQAVIATTMMAFAFSSILTGIVFFSLGAFRLGTLVGYFPRHILVGCIGGVGVFLLETGLEVSRGLKEEGFQYNLATLKIFFESPLAILLWTIPLALAIMLRVITHFFHHQLIFPAYFFLIPVVFYIIVFAGRFDLDHLRQLGWVMNVGGGSEAWWKFYTYFDFKKTDWGAFWAGMPTQLALVFFGILHVPLNVPALGVTLCEDNVKLDRELIAHGVSNLAAGLTGTVPNYLTYVNSVLFYRVGGGSRLSGLMLAAGTAGIMFVGPRVIGYLPVAVVGALIFVLGIDLLLEAVWDTRHKVNRSEYITIWAIAIGMTVWDFVIGLLFGIILACVFFVVQNSRRRAIRAVFSGSTAKSTVRRPRPQRAFLQQVGTQTYVMKLQGFLFFGTISAVEEEIRKLLDLAKWQHNPIRFLIIDFALVAALDFSSAEAFARVQRLLSAKNVRLILCGAAPNGLVGSALQGVGLWADREGTEVEVFEDLNDALEWTENAYLTAYYENQLALEQQQALEQQEARSRTIDFPKVSRAPFTLAESFQNSPRRSHLARAGTDTLPKTHIPLPPEEPEPAAQPLPLLEQTLGSFAPTDFPLEAYAALVPYFHQVTLSTGQTLWKQHESPDGLYLIESGALRATYAYADHGRYVIETMVAGTIAGDLSTLSDTRRNATVVAERECVLWMLSKDELEKMEKDDPVLAMKLIQVVLRAVAEEQDVLASCILLQSAL